MKEIPARGADFFLIDRVAIDAFRRCDEQHVSVFALITWLGFRQEYIEYDKQPRAAGRSGWTIARKIKLVVDSITAFSDAPITACWLVGAALMVIGFLSIVVGPDRVRKLAGRSRGAARGDRWQHRTCVVRAGDARRVRAGARSISRVAGRSI